VRSLNLLASLKPDASVTMVAAFARTLDVFGIPDSRFPIWQ